MYKSRAPLQLARVRNADAKYELSAKISRGILSKRNTILRRGRLLELLLPAIRAAAIISTPSATLISKTRSCDYLNALGRSYQQAVRGLLLVGCWLFVGCCLLLVVYCLLFVWCLLFVFSYVLMNDESPLLCADGGHS